MGDNGISSQDQPTLLRQWLTKQSLTVDELATAMGLSLRYVADIVEGKQPIRNSVMGAFLRAYGPRAAAEAFNLELEPASTQ